MKKFDIILCDAPWSYNDKLTHIGAGAESHYDVMSVKDIASLPVFKLANDNSVLCMWATMPLLPEAFFVIKSWGFKYKTCLITWVKTYPKKTDKFVLGMGSYSRSNIEVCLLATKGKGLKVLTHSESQLMISPRGSHSSKPEEARKKIERLFGKGRRVELFSRKKAKGWCVVGNEIDGVTIEDFILKNFK